MKKTILFTTLLFLLFQISAQNLIKVTTANLNLRSAPEIKRNIIQVIPKGTELTVNYTNTEFSSWVKLSYKGRTGFVNKQYLKNPGSTSNCTIDTNGSHSGTTAKYYTNSKEQKVKSPRHYKKPPAGATAECRDGTYSFSKSRRGTCSHHGGVKRWLK